MPLPLVSVCIITYNHEKYIKRCIESVMMQKTNFKFEVIIGEDCSTDGTAAAVREMEGLYPDIIRPIYHRSNVGGASNAYQYCYPMLTGKYIAICEGDDFWTDPYKLQKQVDYLETHPDISICFHRVNNVDESDRVLGSQQALKQPVVYNPEAIFHLTIPTLSAVIRRCFTSVPDDILQVGSCDAFLFGMMAKYGKAVDLGFIGASYRTHSGGVFSSKRLIDQVKQAINTRKRMAQSEFFSSEHKSEIQREILKRKKKYIKYFFKKKELVNSFKVAFA